MQAALESVKGVSKASVGKKVGDKADTVVTADSSVSVKDMIAALEKKGFTAKEKAEKKGA